MTTTERLARFEAAQEVLGFLMAACAEWIYIESNKLSRTLAKSLSGKPSEQLSSILRMGYVLMIRAALSR